MSEINIANGDARIDAALIASDLELDPAGVLEAMRSGQLASRWERGLGNDAGRYRVRRGARTDNYHNRIGSATCRHAQPMPMKLRGKP
ncbi:MAG: DUF6522 family protein [Steroidobacteraceae bacterium]